MPALFCKNEKGGAETGADTEIRDRPRSGHRKFCRCMRDFLLPLPAPRPESPTSSSGYALLSLPQQMNWLTSSGFVGQVIAL